MDVTRASTSSINYSFQYPQLWLSNPKAWFIMLKANFAFRNLTSFGKYNIIVTALPLLGYLLG